MSTVLEAVEIKVSIGAEQATNAVRAFGLTFRRCSARDSWLCEYVHGQGGPTVLPLIVTMVLTGPRLVVHRTWTALGGWCRPRRLVPGK